MKSHRLARVSEVVRETAANAILFDIKDPRVKGVTVTRAEVSADMQHCKVFVSIMGSEKEQALTMHGLKSAAAFVQTKIADRLTSRYVPHVTFVLDEGVKKSIEIMRILREEQAKLAPPADADAPTADDDRDGEDDGDVEGDSDEGETKVEGPTASPN